MGINSIEPDGENLRLAVRWLSENAPITEAKIEEASQRFDLSPVEEAFLLREFLPSTNGFS